MDVRGSVGLPRKKCAGRRFPVTYDCNNQSAELTTATFRSRGGPSFRVELGVLFDCPRILKSVVLPREWSSSFLFAARLVRFFANHAGISSCAPGCGAGPESKERNHSASFSRASRFWGMNSNRS